MGYRTFVFSRKFTKVKVESGFSKTQEKLNTNPHTAQISSSGEFVFEEERALRGFICVRTDRKRLYVVSVRFLFDV